MESVSVWQGVCVCVCVARCVCVGGGGWGGGGRVHVCVIMPAANLTLTFFITAIHLLSTLSPTNIFKLASLEL